MPDVIVMLMDDIGARVGLDQHHGREAGFSKRTAVGIAIGVGPNVANYGENDVRGTGCAIS